jgi:gamma-glutamylcysteine synthetase
MRYQLVKWLALIAFFVGMFLLAQLTKTAQSVWGDWPILFVTACFFIWIHWREAEFARKRVRQLTEKMLALEQENAKLRSNYQSGQLEAELQSFVSRTPSRKPPN